MLCFYARVQQRLVMDIDRFQSTHNEQLLKNLLPFLQHFMESVSLFHSTQQREALATYV